MIFFFKFRNLKKKMGLVDRTRPFVAKLLAAVLIIEIAARLMVEVHVCQSLQVLPYALQFCVWLLKCHQNQFFLCVCADD